MALVHREGTGSGATEGTLGFRLCDDFAGLAPQGGLALAAAMDFEASFPEGPVYREPGRLVLAGMAGGCGFFVLGNLLL